MMRACLYSIKYVDRVSRLISLPPVTFRTGTFRSTTLTHLRLAILLVLLVARVVELGEDRRLLATRATRGEVLLVNRDLRGRTGLMLDAEQLLVRVELSAALRALTSDRLFCVLLLSHQNGSLRAR